MNWYNRPLEHWYRGWKVPDYIRDNQRAKIYRAERVALDWRLDRRFASIEKIQAYVDKLVGSAWSRRRFGNGVRVSVRAGRGARGWHRVYLTGSERGFQVPHWGKCEPLVLHELSHALAPARSRHCPIFARIYLELIGRQIGPTARKRLLESFNECGVRWKPFRNPKLGEVLQDYRFGEVAAGRNPNAKTRR